MIEDHIETVVMDEPYTEWQSDQSEEHQHEQPDGWEPHTDSGDATLLSWLS